MSYYDDKLNADTANHCMALEATAHAAWIRGDSCGHDHDYDAWLSDTDQWYCEECLVDHFADELGALLELDSWDHVVLVAHTNDDDEFTHFTIADGMPSWMLHDEITLEEILTTREEIANDRR